jgi:hypothetical protein
LIMAKTSGVVEVSRPASTVHRILARHSLNRLSFLDRPTGQVIRRMGFDYVHSAVDDHSRLALPENLRLATGPDRPRRDRQTHFSRVNNPAGQYTWGTAKPNTSA